ncbi:rRNA pseudouridine synthase [bacterium SCSIO 12643]|nr:rRNA pseudouridine synthase [bacterium SCSIO 12643]
MSRDDFNSTENNSEGRPAGQRRRRIRISQDFNESDSGVDGNRYSADSGGERAYTKVDKNGYHHYRKQGYKPRRKQSFIPKAQGIERAFNEKDGERLNKYLANAGICSRREADKLIAAGIVSINDNPVTTLGTRVMKGDVVKLAGEELKMERMVYVVLNKPKDTITTLDDPQGRRTVIDIVKNACKERIYPVGRLDRYTTGVLLLTNDGEMATRLTHPSFGITKVYNVKLDRDVTPEDLKRVTEGIELADGVIKADSAFYYKDGVKDSVRLELHSGKNRVIRRIFESMGYRVVSLERISFAGITKKKLGRGKFRFLDPLEVGSLKMLKSN